jgi:photosystem II stability/assembly factor-like uncharacterized protein
VSNGWELLARWPGGAVPALIATDGASVMAATAAGLHASPDGGHSWTWLGLGPDAVPEALIAAAGGRGRTILLGTTSGVHRSTNGGRSWRAVLVGSRVQCLAATPDLADGDTILAGTDADGIVRSEDGGLSWSGVSAGLLDLNVTALVLSPTIGRDRTAFAGTTTGLYRSRNGGRAWRLVELGPEAPAIQSIAVSPSFEQDRLVLAGTERDGLFRSDDGGQTWEPAAGFPEPCVTCLAFGEDGEAQNVVAAGTAAGVAISRDGGRTWTLEVQEAGPILSIALAADDHGPAILAGTVAGGIVRRTLTSPGWTPANQGLAGRATVDLAVSTAYGEVPLIVVASLDAGILLSHDAGATWATGYGGLSDLAATSVAVVQLPRGAPSAIAAFAGRLFRSEDLASGWRPVDVGAAPAGNYSALRIAGNTAGGSAVVVASGSGGLALSLDGGETWRAIPPPRPGAEAVGATAAPDFSRDRTLYAVTRATQIGADGTPEPNGLELWQTADLGRRWTRWLHSPGAAVMPIAVPAAGDLDTALLVGHAGRIARPLRSAQEVRRGERRPLWHETPVGNPGSAVTALALSPRLRQDRTILAAADNAVYLSRDGGATFATWEDGLDVPLVTGLALARVDDGLMAYALGLGGTLWRRRLPY